MIVYVCSKCGKEHSFERYGQIRFCDNCGKRLSRSEDRKGLTDEQPRADNSGVRTSLEKAYETIRRQFPYARIDSLDVVRQVEEYRRYWKPDKVNVVLLAESHVYTDNKDFEIELDRYKLQDLVPNYPSHFVKFVYCLGYGENKLLCKVRTDRRNAGTPQYWKMFSACVAEDEDHLGFDKVLKTRTRSSTLRLRNKVEVLRKLKEKGVWLLDASIVGLYRGRKEKRRRNVTEGILAICWGNHMEHVIRQASPRHIVVVGKDVHRALRSEISKLHICTTVIRQPSRDYRSSEEQLEKYRVCQRICAKYN